MNCYYFGFLVFLFLFVNSCDIEYDVNYLLIINYYYVIYVVFNYVNKFEDVYYNLYLEYIFVIWSVRVELFYYLIFQISDFGLFFFIYYCLNIFIYCCLKKFEIISIIRNWKNK